jgi:hypothetical protein
MNEVGVDQGVAAVRRRLLFLRGFERVEDDIDPAPRR